MPAEAIRINRRVLLQCSIGAPGLKQPFAQPQQNGALSALPSLTNNTMNVGFVNSSPKCHSRFGLGPVIPVPYENGRFVRTL